MALIAFKNTHNQTVFVNPDHVAYVTTFEEDVTVIAFAIMGAGGKPVSVYVRGSVEQVQHRLSGAPAARQVS